MNPNVTEGPHAELSTLLDSWQHATERLEQAYHSLCGEVGRLRGELAEKSVVHSERQRLANLGAAAGHIARDLRCRLEPVHDYLHLLQPRVNADEGAHDLLLKALEELTALEATALDLCYLTTQREPDWELLSIHDLIHNAHSSLAAHPSSQRVMWAMDVPPDAYVTGDREWLERAIHNLMLNALESMPEGGELTVTAVGGERDFELEIADSGPGLRDGARGRRFEPFVQAQSGGSGLRLAVVCHLLQRLGGDAIAMNCPQGGAAFTLRIPRRDADLPVARAA